MMPLSMVASDILENKFRYKAEVGKRQHFNASPWVLTTQVITIIPDTLESKMLGIESCEEAVKSSIIKLQSCQVMTTKQISLTSSSSLPLSQVAVVLICVTITVMREKELLVLPLQSHS